MASPSPLPMIENCTAVILAGGESKRMGQDKASLWLKDKTLLQHTLDQVSPLFVETDVSVRDIRPTLAYPQIQDSSPKRSPMVGIAAALSQCSSAWLFVVACDMPLIVPELIVQMAQQRKHEQIVVPQCHGFYQPLLAFYPQSCLNAMQSHLAKQQRSLQRFIQTQQHHILAENWLKQYDPDLRSFFDLDTPEDLQQVQRPEKFSESFNNQSHLRKKGDTPPTHHKGNNA